MRISPIASGDIQLGTNTKSGCTESIDSADAFTCFSTLADASGTLLGTVPTAATRLGSTKDKTISSVLAAIGTMRLGSVGTVTTVPVPSVT